ncbi:FkbM family methyltransferase [Parerythrobacter jejuensis]|uniref:FkbM family methyltransferase n=1 Tax=Parerythrobacter jejuensis TaxID=795812 RepID=A0A845ASS8_9SPHN|nr:FkbM family methyltransferase [Parerythrobacter jejuensis]MXP31566.1 FkbM family methyltransferase [Parerythrobacter jejuensis]
MKLFRPYLWGGRVIKLARRLGMDVMPALTRDHRVAGARLGWRDEEPGLLRGAVVEGEHDGVPLKLFVANDLDVIQQVHRKGELYEPEELAIIKGTWDQHHEGGAFLDVGANVGNHALFAAMVLGADKVIACEPQDAAARILETNAALNHVADRIAIHRVGLSDSAGQASVESASNNLGAARLTQGKGGIELVTGDALVGDQPIGFIKIDTEGFELPVLRGLSGTIARDHPPLFVEVETANLPAFEQICAGHGYAITNRFQRYETSVNCLAIARD